MPFKVGDVIDEKFRIEGTLGAGGMGTVFAARHLGLDKDVALKVLTVAADPAVKARFLREARAVAKLETDAVAQVFDIGTTRRGIHYIVMERLRGVDLGALVRARGPLEIGEAVSLMLEAFAPLEEAHAAGIIHRDLKPQNLFLAETRQGKKVKLLDFGVSRLASSEDTLTAKEEVLGTPRFMPPEQLAGAHYADARSDVYSAGACLFVLLTNEAPLSADSLSGLLFAIRNRIPRRVDEIRPEIPAALADVIARCLEKDPGRRFQSIAELSVALSATLSTLAPPTRMPNQHLDDEAIVALQEGRLAGGALRRVHAHLAECRDCRELVGAAADSRVEGDLTISDETRTSASIDPHANAHANANARVAADATEAPIGRRASPATVPMPGASSPELPPSIAAPPTLQSPAANALGNTFATLVSGEKASARTARTQDTAAPRRSTLLFAIGMGTAVGVVLLGGYLVRSRASNDHASPTSNASSSSTMPSATSDVPAPAASTVAIVAPSSSAAPSLSPVLPASSASSSGAVRSKPRSPSPGRPSSPSSISNDIPNER